MGRWLGQVGGARTTSDPMCEITACAEDENGLLCLRQAFAKSS